MPFNITNLNRVVPLVEADGNPDPVIRDRVYPDLPVLVNPNLLPEESLLQSDPRFDLNSSASSDFSGYTPTGMFTPEPNFTSGQPQSVVAGMFPEVEAMQRALYQQKQNEAMQAQAMQFARLSPMEQAQYSLYMGGQQLGGAIGSALGGKDPQLQMIAQRQQMLNMIDPNKPETYGRAIQYALQTGDSNTAQILNNEMKNAQARKTENLQLELQKLAQTLYKPDGSIDENVYATLQSYGAVGLAIIDQQVKGTQGLESQQVQNLARGLINLDGTRNKEVEQQLSRTIAGREILKKFDPETKKTITIGNRVLDASNMSVLYTAPDAPPAAVAEWKAFQALPKNEQQSFLNLQVAKRPNTTINMPNEGERKAATLANRLNFSVDQINQAIGVDPSAAMPNTSIEIARFLSRTEMIPNKFTSAQRQIVESAQLDILDAALTLGTGAAYTREQLEGYRKSYFPQINDKPENVAAKRARLQNILKSAEIASGRAKVPTPIPTLDADLSSIINAPPSN